MVTDHNVQNLLKVVDRAYVIGEQSIIAEGKPKEILQSAKARELYFLSDRISADQALELGLTNWVVEPENLELKTKEIAEKLASGPAVAFRYMKENLNRAMHGDVDDCLDLEATHHIHCGQTHDHKNAVKAFVEKKEPVFEGK